MKKFLLLGIGILLGHFAFSQKHIDGVTVSPTTVCQGGTITITLTYNNSYSSVFDTAYSFFSDLGGSTYSIANLINKHTLGGTTFNYTYNVPQGTAAGTYRIYVSDSVASTQIDTFSNTFTVNAAATVSAGSPTIICAGAAYTLNGATIGGSATTGTWSITGVTGSMTNNASQLSSTSATATPDAVTFTPISGNSGTVTLMLTTDDPTGPCNAVNSSVTLTVNPVATANAGSATTICSGVAYALTGASVGGGATTGTWSITGVTGTMTNNSSQLSNTSATATPATVTFTPIAPNTGTVTLTLTTDDPAGPCGVATSTVVLTVNPPATANAGSPATICSGAAYTLTGASIGGGASTGTWSITAVTGSMTTAASQLSNTGATANPASVTFTPIAGNSGTVTLTLTTDNPTGPCNAVTSTVLLTVNAAATANAGSANTICSGVAYTLTGASVGGSASTGTWSITAVTGTMTNNSSQLSNTSATASPASVTFTPIAANSGTVTLTLTTDDPSGPCGAVTSTVLLTVNPAATVNAGSPATICSGSAYTLTGATIGGGAATGTWSITAVTGSMTNASSQLSNTSATANPAAVTFTPIAANSGTVTLTLTTDNPSGPCGAVTSTVLLTVNPAATANAGNNATICKGTSYTLTGATIGGGATTGTWSITAVTGTMTNASSQLSNTSATANPAAVIFSPIAGNTGTVTLTLTTDDPAGPCGVTTSTMVITVNSDATASAGSSNTICSGAPYTLAGATIGGSASTGTWSIVAVTGTMTNATSQLSNTGPTANPAAVVFTPIATNSGTITLTLTTDDPAGPCLSANSSVVLTVNLAPTVNAGSNTTICSGVARAMTGATLGGGAINGTWTITGVTGSMTNAASQLSNTSATTTPSTVTFTPISPNSGTVTLTLTSNTAAPCSAVSSSVTLTVNPPATADAGLPKSVCQGGTITLGGTRGGSATGSTWSAPSGTFSNASSLTSTYTPSITNGNVTLTLTTSGPCAPATSTVVITVNPTATADAGPAMTAICQTATSAALGGSVGGSATGGTWSDNGIGGTFNPNATTLNATYTPPTLFSGMVTLTLTASGGSCGTPTASKALLVIPNATVSLASGITNQVLCLGNPISDIKYTIGGGGTGTNVTGLPAGVVGVLVGTVFTISGTPTVSGTFNYTVTTTGICAPATKTGTITINPKPTKPEFLTTNPTTVCFNQKGVNFGVKPQTDVEFFWVCANTNLVEFHGQHRANCLIDFPAAGSPFTIYAIATNSITGCKDTSVLTLTVTSTIPSTPRILLTNSNKTLVCLDNTQATYQWGYDDTSFTSNDISGATLQDYTPAGGINPNRNYYVRLNSGGCTYKVYYNAPLGVSSGLNQTSIAIQPNPNKGQFNLKLTGNKISQSAIITDVLGQSIMNLALHQGDNYIQMPAVANGIYYIQLIDNSGNSQTLKFIINQ